MTLSSSILTSSEKFSSKTMTLIPRIFLTPILLKLDTDNFLVWRQQVTATLSSMDLLHFLKGSCISSRLISAEGGSISSMAIGFNDFRYSYKNGWLGFFSSSLE